MNYQFTIQFSEEHIRYACRKFFARYIGIAFPAVCLALLVWGGLRIAQGQRDLFAGVILSVAALGIIFVVAAYFQNCSYRLSQFRQTGNAVSYELSEELFKAKSGMGSTELNWESFKAIWVFQKVWLLMFDKAGYLTLPTDQVSNEVKEFLKQKIVSVGGKVK
jgi:hypothetical protein